MYALNIDKDRRILSATFQQYAPADAVIVEALPEKVAEWQENPMGEMPSEANLHNYLYIGGYIYDPLPKPDAPEQPGGATLEERVSTVENDVASLTAAIERGLSL